MQFENEKELETWLMEQEHATRIAIATRAALRVLPLVTGDGGWQSTPEAKEAQNTIALLTGRCILIAGVAGKWPTPAIMDAATAATTTDARATLNALDATLATTLAARAALHANDAATLATHAALHANDAAARATTDAARATLHANDAAALATLAAALHRDCDFAADEMISQPLWHEAGPPKELRPEDIGQTVLERDPRFDFFRRWHAGMVAGAPIDWELQRRIALIDPKIWDAGIDDLAPAILRIEANYRTEIASHANEITEKELRQVTTAIVQNRDAITLGAAGLLEQLAAFHEKIRGLNSLDPDFKEELLKFLNHFYAQLEDFIETLPYPEKEPDASQANRAATFVREYKTVVTEKFQTYFSAESLGEATVPTAIILTASALGSMFGQPLIGGIVGGLITSQMKPGQAAAKLTQKPKPDGE